VLLLQPQLLLAALACNASACRGRGRAGRQLRACGGREAARETGCESKRVVVAGAKGRRPRRLLLLLLGAVGMHAVLQAHTLCLGNELVKAQAAPPRV
jgi:hypothetical protein